MPNQNKTPQVRQTDAADAASALVVLLARVAAREFLDAGEGGVAVRRSLQNQSSSKSNNAKE